MAVLPRHIAIVMDGNGRWAKQRKLPRLAGHRAGVKAVRRSVEFCVQHQIEALTLFALSVENRAKRPAKEIQFLLSLFLDSLERYTNELNDNHVRLRVVGDFNGLDQKLREQIQRSMALTASNTGLNLVVAINYSGRWDILQATRTLAKRVAEQSLLINDIQENILNEALCLSDLPEPDLLIRTSGEQRISNFLLWQLAYTELYFTDVYWPDFDDVIFQQALDFYGSRERRFGLTGEQVEQHV